MMTLLRRLIPVALVVLAACPGKDLNVGNVHNDAGVSDGADVETADSPIACPFVASPKAIVPGTILAAGKSPTTGTLYVVDQVDSLQRVFVSGADSDQPDNRQILKRQRVSGSASGSDPSFLMFNTDGPDAVVTIQIDMPTGQPKRMGVYPGLLKDKKTMVVGVDGEELTILADTDVSNLPLVNLPGTVTIEYVAATGDGRFVLVTRPTDDWTFDDFRLFFGPPTAISEHVVTKVTRNKDGGSTFIEFDLDGATARANFPVNVIDGVVVPGLPTVLITDSQMISLTLLSEPPADASYICLVP